MLGFIYAAIAGAAMSIQGVMNSRLSEKTGLFEANMFVQLTAFVLSLIVMLIWGNGSIKGKTALLVWRTCGNFNNRNGYAFH